MALRDVVPHSKISQGLCGATPIRCFVETTFVLIYQTEYPKLVSSSLGYQTCSSTVNPD